MTLQSLLLSAFSRNLKKSHLNKPEILAQTVVDFVNASKLKLRDPLPSIQSVSEHCKIAKETVRQAYNILKRNGVVDAKRGRAYFVITEHYKGVPNVFLMFNYFGTPHKVETLKGILAGVGDKAKLSFFSHYKDPDTFVKTLNDAKGKYDYYVVMPLRDEKCAKALAEFDQSKLLLIDIDIDYPNKSCPKIIQNFNEKFYDILLKLEPSIKKYPDFTLSMVIAGAPREHKTAFEKFCKKFGFKYEFIDKKLEATDIKDKKIWFLFDDDDLVTAVKRSDELGLKIKKDYAIVSYNDIPIKHIICGGITTISIDFFALGERVAKQILSWDPTCDETVETYLIDGKTI